jgi:hypothetical protein
VQIGQKAAFISGKILAFVKIEHSIDNQNNLALRPKFSAIEVMNSNQFSSHDMGAAMITTCYRGRQISSNDGEYLLIIDFAR